MLDTLWTSDLDSKDAWQVGGLKRCDRFTSTRTFTAPGGVRLPKAGNVVVLDLDRR
jgi:hypothetical protein